MREGYYKPRPLPRKPVYPRVNTYQHHNRMPPKDPHKKLLKVKDKKKKSPNILIIGVIALIFLIAIVILLIKIFGNDDSGNSPIPSEEELEMIISSAYEENGMLIVVVDVISGDDSLNSIKFTFEGNGKEETFLKTYSPYGSEEFYFTLNKLDLEDVSKISITPIMDDSNGNTQTGNVQDTYFFDYVPDNSDDDSNNLPYDDYLDNNDNNNSSNNCTSHNSYKCYNGSVYWYDSCNKVEELKEACVSGEECLFGTCIEDNDPPNPPVVPVLPSCGNNILEEKEYCDGIELAGETCASFGFSLGTLACNAYCTFDISGCYNPGDSSEDSENDSECVLTSFYACNQGDVYWYDSCGNPSQVKEYCSSSQVCNQNQCEEDNGGYSLPPPPQIPNIPS